MSYPKDYDPDQEYAIIGIREGIGAKPLRPIAYLAQRSLGILGQPGYVPTYTPRWNPKYFDYPGIPHAALYGLDPARKGGTLREEKAAVEYLIKQTFPGSFTWQKSFWYRPQESEHWYFYDPTDPLKAPYASSGDDNRMMIVFIPCDSIPYFEVIHDWFKTELLQRFPSFRSFHPHRTDEELEMTREGFDATNTPCLVHLASYPPTMVRYPPPRQRRRVV